MPELFLIDAVEAPSSRVKTYEGYLQVQAIKVVGVTHSDIKKDGNQIKAGLTIFDQKSIDQIEAGKTGLSCGYHLTINMTPGVTDEGDSYDGYQENITGNHVAICALDAARGGTECRILDSKKMRVLKMSDSQMQLPDLSDINQLGQLMQKVIGMLEKIESHLITNTTLPNF